MLKLLLPRSGKGQPAAAATAGTNCFYMLNAPVVTHTSALEEISRAILNVPPCLHSLISFTRETSPALKYTLCALPEAKQSSTHTAAALWLCRAQHSAQRADKHTALSPCSTNPRANPPQTFARAHIPSLSPYEQTVAALFHRCPVLPERSTIIPFHITTRSGSLAGLTAPSITESQGWKGSRG